MTCSLLCAIHHQSYGLVYGFAIASGVWSTAPISGGALNPAVGTAINLVSMVHGKDVGHIWVYWAGPCSGAICAVIAFFFLTLPESMERDHEDDIHTSLRKVQMQEMSNSPRSRNRSGSAPAQQRLPSAADQGGAYRLMDDGHQGGAA